MLLQGYTINYHILYTKFNLIDLKGLMLSTLFMFFLGFYERSLGPLGANNVVA